MADWPNPLTVQLPQRRLLPDFFRRQHVTAYASATAWPAANDALFTPFEVDQTVTVTQIHLIVETSSGNLDVGIYDTAGAKMVSMGATAMAVAGVQTFNITDTVLLKGRYFVGVAVDNGVANIGGWTAPAVGAAYVRYGNIALGFQKQATAYPLPSPATFAACTSSFFPAVVLELL